MSEINPVFDAFRLHDERGLPLAVSVAAGIKFGIQVNLAAFACDALNAGWSEERMLREIGSACADNGIHFEPEVFSLKLRELFTLSSRRINAGGFLGMKQFILDTPNRIKP